MVGEIGFEDGGDPLPQFRDLIDRGIPDDLQVEVEVGVHNPVAHGDDLSPGYIRVALAKFRRQTVDGLADHC